MPTHMPASFTRHDFHKPYKKRERGTHTTPHHNKWNFHCGPTILKLNSLSKLRGDELPRLTVQNLEASGVSAASPYPRIDASSRSFWALLVYPCGIVASCVPLALLPDQKYNSLGAPLDTYRGHIAFTSQGRTYSRRFRPLDYQHIRNNTFLVVGQAVALNPSSRSRSPFLIMFI